MKIYLNRTEAVIKLHEKGYTEDFELFGNDLLWIQEKIFIRPKDFVIAEVHRFPEVDGNEVIVFGVIANAGSTKGILIKDCGKSESDTPEIIRTKLAQMNREYVQIDYTYSIFFDNRCMF